MTDQAHPRKRSFSLFAVVGALVAIQIVLISAVLIGLNAYYGNLQVREIVAQNFADARQHIFRALDRSIQQAEQAAQFNYDLARKEDISLLDRAFWKAQFWHQKQLFPFVSYLAVGDAKGRWVGLKTYEDMRYEWADPPVLYSQDIDGQGADLGPTTVKDKYDPLTMDWYHLPREKGHGIWTPVYKWFERDTFSMTYSLPLTGAQGFEGLIAVDITLDHTAKNLRQAAQQIGGYAVAMDNRGNILAIAADQEALVEDTREGQSPSINQLETSPLFDKAMSVVRNSDGRTGIQEIRLGDEDYFVSGGNYRTATGIDFQVLVIVPTSHYLGNLHAVTRANIAVMVLVVLLGLLTSAWLGRRMARPIQWLVAQSERVSQLHTDQPIERQSRIAEINQLTDAFERMRVGLESFTRFVPDQLVRSIVTNSRVVEKEGSKKYMTFMFADIRKYSTLVEELEPQYAVSLLDAYFGRMQEIVARHGGIVLEQFGDGMLAVFGHPKELENHPRSAAEAALEMQEKLETMNDEWMISGENRLWAAIGVPRIQQRIGIHTGDAVAGVIGGSEYLKYAVVGDNVNVAARLEQLCSQIGCSIAISEQTYEAIGDESVTSAFRAAGSYRLKGRKGEIKVYADSDA